jgi:hypothetical protein
VNPVFQSIRGDAQRTQAGDCFRACVASILELSLDDVPHFFVKQRTGTKVTPQLETAMQDWFRKLGLGFVTLPVQADTPNEAMGLFGNRYPNLYYILIGQSIKGVNHAVVCRGPYMAHDPARPAMGLAAPQENGLFLIGLLVLSEWKT